MIYFLSLGITFSLTFFQVSTGWQDIVPLHSTRADVEHLLGKSGDELKTLYKTDGATVLVDYAPRPCKGVLPGWSVPADTVLRLTIRPITQQRFAELDLKLEEFITRRDDTFTTYYLNEIKGLEYEVTSEGLVSAISYLPSTKDFNLRCPGFPFTGENAVRHYPIDTYVGADFDNEKYHLDKLAIRLQQDQNAKAYLILYAAKSMCVGEAKFRLSRAENYLMKVREIDGARIETMLGGGRSKLTIEVYMTSKDAPSPIANPTKKINFRNCGTREKPRRGGIRRT